MLPGDNWPGYCVCMTQPDWSARLVAVVAGEVRRYRNERGLSAQQLSDACSNLGMPIPRSVLANLESGRRTTLTVPELLILAKALGVPPLLLVFPVGRRELTEALPGREVPTWEAARWFTGEEPFPTRHGDEWLVSTQDHADWAEGGAPLVDMRFQEALFKDWRQARNAVADAWRRLEEAEGDEARQVVRGEIAARERAVRDVEAELRRVRSTMRSAGLDPGELTENLRHVDQVGGDQR